MDVEKNGAASETVSGTGEVERPLSSVGSASTIRHSDSKARPAGPRRSQWSKLQEIEEGTNEVLRGRYRGLPDLAPPRSSAQLLKWRQRGLRGRLWGCDTSHFLSPKYYTLPYPVCRPPSPSAQLQPRTGRTAASMRTLSLSRRCIPSHPCTL